MSVPGALESLAVSSLGLDQIEVEDFQGSDEQGGGHSDREVRNSCNQQSEMEKDGDAGDAVCANFFLLCKFFGFAHNFLHNFANF